ncbi:MerR family transcriptional regulator [Streptomyces sp. P38-E01]|uniref:MerR family transcriptional regulator n=1 Tax=Streptomyces tardus TaxID=2780544 RepID=A0A949JE60_9ACTN|nr:MerR family transcriptional regulator [Streptomyces tardus]
MSNVHHSTDRPGPASGPASRPGTVPGERNSHASAGHAPAGHGCDGGSGLTVGQVAAHLDVTVRALHHWDEIGLARPSLRTAAGYRLYTAEDLERLHRVVVYREIGLGLDRIRSVLDDPATGVTDALRAQRDRITEKIDRLRRLGTGLDRMIDAHERGLLLTAEQQTAVFGPHWNPEWPAQARHRYGDTAQWQQYAERAAARGPEEWRAVADAVARLDRALGDAMEAGVTPGSPAANRLVERHREVFAAYFPLSRQMQVCLARMYEADPGCSAHYDALRSGLAAWFREIVDANARAHGVDPDTAIWE